MDWDAWSTVLYLFVAPIVVLYIGVRIVKSAWKGRSK